MRFGEKGQNTLVWIKLCKYVFSLCKLTNEKSILGILIGKLPPKLQIAVTETLELETDNPTINKFAEILEKLTTKTVNQINMDLENLDYSKFDDLRSFYHKISNFIEQTLPDGKKSDVSLNISSFHYNLEN